MSTDVEAELTALIGRTLIASDAQDPVNTPMIRHWAEAMGDDNPIYLDEEAARATGRAGTVAPATMAQAWTMRGYAAHQRRLGGEAGGRRPEEDELIAALARAGYTAVVATDSDFEFVREVVPGDHLSVEEVLESVSAEKTTALGVGRFLTTLRSYRDADGEVVARQRWSTLRFRPHAKAEPSATESAERTPRPGPALNADNEWWFAAAREHRLLVQRCAQCGVLRHPPGPCCPACQTLEWDTVEATGAGTLYSFTVVHHPRHPAFDYPLVIAVVELAEGTRLITNIVGGDPDTLTIGVPVALSWLDLEDGLTLPVFRMVEEG